jgi:hypothetical protein
MKVIIEYTILHGRPLIQGTCAKAVRAIGDPQIAPGTSPEFPVQRLEYGVEDGSAAARRICEILGLTVPAATS